jgi:hypothetical protein
MIGKVSPNTLRLCLILLAMISFLADLADDGRLTGIHYDSQNKTISYSYKLTQDSSSENSHFDLQDVIGENALFWQEPKISPKMGMVLCIPVPNLPQFSVWISIATLSAICPCHNPYYIDRGCGGLPLIRRISQFSPN